MATSLWELWCEIVQDSQSLSDPVLIDVFAGGGSHRAFDNISDEDLKGVLSKIKSLLNEPKSREKGAGIFQEMISIVEPKRLVGLQESLLTALRLLCSDKFLHSVIVQQALAIFLPKCKNYPDILKELTPKNGYVSKIVASCIEELQPEKDKGSGEEKRKSQRQPSSQVLKLLRVCMINFRGTCGHFRERLEKGLMPFLDHDNEELVRFVCNLLPLLSQIGGGGSRGDNHSKDWTSMVQKLVKEAYDCLYLLCSDCTALDDENPFLVEGSGQNLEPLLSPITDKKVFVKVSSIKKRLVNLIQAIGAYLRRSFPSHKPVPAKSLLKLISYLISVNPIELLASQKQAPRKELLFLAALLPSVHSSAFKLLDDIVVCLGTNIFPQAVAVEQLFSQQWHWMANNNAFIDLKRSMYSSLSHWLNMTKGVSNSKTSKLWVEYFTKEIQLEKETVELRILSGKSKNKLHSRMTPMSKGMSSNCDGLNANNAFLQKNPETCEISLDILIKLLPSMDPEMHKNLYCTLVKTHVHVYQQGSYPGQYESINCRIKLNASLVELALHPHARSSISLGLIVNLLTRASLDLVSKVSEFCICSLSTLERLIHPTSQSMEFPLNLIDPNYQGSTADRSSVVLNNLLKIAEPSEMEVEETVDGYTHESTVTVDSGCQTDRPASTEDGIADIDSDQEDEEAPQKNKSMDNANNTNPSLTEIMTELRYLRQKVEELGSSTQQTSTTFTTIGQYNLPSDHVRPSSQEFNDSASNKRKLFDADNTIVSNGHSTIIDNATSTKQSKMTDGKSTDVDFNPNHNLVSPPHADASDEVIEMLHDFVDEPSLNNSNISL